MADRPIGHTLVYGDSGAGKSTGASTWPKPMLVFMFDPLGKDMPYLKRGDCDTTKTMAAIAGLPAPDPAGRFMDERGTPYRIVLHPTQGTQIMRIEYYIDRDPRKPEAWGRFLDRLDKLDRDLADWNIQSVVFDSITFAEISARKQQQYVLNPSSKEPRQWFAGSTDTLEEVLMIRFGSLPLNVVVLAHIDEDKDEVHGTFIRNPSAPGRLRKRGAAGYSELYRAYIRRDGEAFEYLWQTRSDALWNAASQIGAPSPCPQSYRALWTP